MPELPEVAIARDNLDRWTCGRMITAVEGLGGTLHGELERLVGRRFSVWTRQGKYLLGRLDSGGALLSHLGMTGKWVRDAGERPHQRLRIHLATATSMVTGTATNGQPEAISLVDARKLGITWLLAGADLIAHPRLAKLGPDALALGGEELRRRCGRGRVALKTRLMDQSRIAGLGNICAIEACFRARVHPHRAANEVEPAQWQALSAAIDAHIAAVIDAESGDEIAYVGEGGANPFLVYGRAGQGCPVCGTTIASARLAGRVTTFCPSCQPQPLPNPGAAS